jgi:glycosyltransferase involved in cell wall biosynthesis
MTVGFPPPSRPLRVLWTLPYVPYPATNGGKQRQLGLLTQMARRGHAITLLCLSKTMPDAAAHAHLAALLENVLVLPRRSRVDPRMLARAACSLSRPAVATINGCDPTFEAVFDDLLEQRFDIVQVEHSYSFEPLARPLARRQTRFVLTEHNVESDVVQAQYQRLPWPLRGLGALDALRCRTWERAVMQRAACVVAVAAPDEPRFAAMGARDTALVVNAIDVGAYAQVVPLPRSACALFLGNYEYSPNTDAVAWLCDEIMPRVWRDEPLMRLAVYGHAMPSAWRARWPDPRIAFGGYAKNLPALHAGAAMFVAPLRFGGGSKLKVMEAMASALPVVATPEAVSGLALTEGLGYVGGNDAEQIAAGMVRCLREPIWAAAVGLRARAYVRDHHDWAAAAMQLERVWHRVLARASSDAHA